VVRSLNVEVDSSGNAAVMAARNLAVLLSIAIPCAFSIAIVDVVV
jgi:hypothetical protein